MAKKGNPSIERALLAVAIVLAFTFLADISTMQANVPEQWSEASSFFQGFLGSDSLTGAEVVSISEETAPAMPAEEAPTISSEWVGIQNGGYGVQEDANSSECGYVSSSLTLTNNVINRSTCFTINASHLTIDCAGYMITYGESAAGYGINNTGGFDNITIKSCVIKKGSVTGSRNYGLFFTNASMSNTIQNNTILTNGSAFGTGIYLFNASNGSIIRNNTIITNGSAGGNIGIYLNLSCNNNTLYGNRVISTGNGTQNYGIAILSSRNNSILANTISTNGTSNNNGIDLSSSNENIINSNNVLSGGTSNSNMGISLTSSDDVTLQNTTVRTSGTSDNVGVYLTLSLGNEGQIASNNITTNGSSDANYGILVEQAHNWTISGNTIITNGGALNVAVYLSSSNNTEVELNNITSGGTSVNNYAVYIAESPGAEFANNNISSARTSASGILLANDGNGQHNALLLNNKIDAGGFLEIDDQGDADSSTIFLNNTVWYNNTFGSIYWNATNLDANVTLEIGTTVYLQQNLVGLTDNAQRLNLSLPAQIQIRNLSYPSRPIILKDGVRCDNSSACNISSYNPETGVLMTSVNSFSNYSTTANCGYLNTNTTLVANVNSSGTCFFVNASNLVIDCVGYMINYSEASAGEGINITGFNGTMIKNCFLTERNQSGIQMQNTAIYVRKAANTTIVNNSIITLRTSSEALGFQSVTGTNVTNNTLYTFWASAIEADDWNQSRVEKNMITGAGGTTGSTADGIQCTDTYNLTAFNNTFLIGNGPDTVTNRGIVCTGLYNGPGNISANRITTTSGESSHAIWLSGSGGAGVGVVIAGNWLNTSLSGDAIRFHAGGNDTRIYNNTIAQAAEVGIDIPTASSMYRSIITNNVIRNASDGIFSGGVADTITQNSIVAVDVGLESAANQTNFTLNNATITGSSGTGIKLSSGSANVTAYQNIILLNASSWSAMAISISGNNTILENTFNSTVTGTQFLNLQGARGNLFQDNIFATNESLTYGFLLQAGSKENTFLNNSFQMGKAAFAVYDTTVNRSTIFYNLTLGSINWTANNLTTNITLRLNETFFIQSDLVGLTDNPQALTLDGPASIEIRNLTYTSTPTLYKDGTACSNPTCNFSYDATTGVLTANISSFSNYSTTSSSSGSSSSSSGGGSSSSSSGGGSAPPAESAPAAPAPVPEAPPESTIPGLTATVSPTTEAAAASAAESQASVGEAASTIAEAVQTAPLAQTQSISVSFSNEGSSSLVLTPEVKALDGLVDGQLAKISELYRHQLEGLTEEEQQQKLRELVYVLEILDQEQVQSLLGKVASFYQEKLFFIGLIPSGKQIAGRLLLPEILNKEDIIVLPGETINKVLEIRSLGAKAKRLTLRFTSQDGDYLEQEIVTSPEPRVGSAVDYDAKEGIIDLYVIIPAYGAYGALSEENTENTYWLEYNINTQGAGAWSQESQESSESQKSPDSPESQDSENTHSEDTLTGMSIAGSSSERTTIIADLLGPYVVASNESLSLAQQFEIRGNLIGPYLLETTMYRGATVIARHEFPLNLQAGSEGTESAGEQPSLVPLVGMAGAQRALQFLSHYQAYLFLFAILALVMFMIVAAIPHKASIPSQSVLPAAEPVLKPVLEQPPIPKLKGWAGRRTDLPTEFEAVQTIINQLRREQQEEPSPEPKLLEPKPFRRFSARLPNVTERVLEQQLQRLDQRVSGYKPLPPLPPKERLSGEQRFLRQKLIGIEKEIEKDISPPPVKVRLDVPTASGAGSISSTSLSSEVSHLRSAYRALLRPKAREEIDWSDPQLQGIQKELSSLDSRTSPGIPQIEPKRAPARETIRRALRVVPEKKSAMNAMKQSIAKKSIIMKALTEKEEKRLQQLRKERAKVEQELAKFWKD